MAPHPFQLPFDNHLLRGDSYRTRCQTLLLHGAGNGSRSRYVRMRQALNSRGIPSASFDFIGHGETGGPLSGSSLLQRTRQAALVIRNACCQPLTLIGASMSGYTAIRLTGQFEVANLVLLVPAVYTPRAYDLPFGPEFSAVIRKPGSWQDSDAFDILSRFKGNLLILAAENDRVIPDEVINGIHGSARNARTRQVHTVPGSGHSNLFPTEADFLVALEKILTLHGTEATRAPLIRPRPDSPGPEAG